MRPEPPPAQITAVGLVKRFGDVAALDGFDLEVEAGAILGLLGPSGCGKTTVLRVIAGFELPDAGAVTIGGRVVVGPGVAVPPEQRRVGMVFQDYALFPHLTVARNVGYGLPRAGQAARVGAALEMVGLAGHGRAMPHELSGGEQQRVALARALAPRPAVVLLDEPFSNLDAPQRDRMRREVRTILVEARATAVFVTHDQEDALATSDLVAVMRAGRVVQVAPPDVVYRHPVDPWVARFLGEGLVLAGTARGDVVETAVGVLPLVAPAHGDVQVMVRPEAVRLAVAPDGPAQVVDREFYGHDQLVTVEFAGGLRIQSRLGPAPALMLGERVSVDVEQAVAFGS